MNGLPAWVLREWYRAALYSSPPKPTRAEQIAKLRRELEHAAMFARVKNLLAFPRII